MHYLKYIMMLLLTFHERYLSIPKEIPKISLLEAIDSSLFSLLKAEEIVALYVIHSNLDRDTSVVWEIYTWGIQTSYSARYPELPCYQ